MDLEIRVADLDDADDGAGIIEVLDTYASDPVGGGEPLSADVRRRLIPALRELRHALVFLAVSDGRPVGVATCFFGFSTFKACPLLNVHDLAVIPSHRGRGVGRRLLAAAEEHARARGCCKLTLEVQEDNLPARALYARFGFADFVVGNSAPTRFLSKPLPE